MKKITIFLLSGFIGAASAASTDEMDQQLNQLSAQTQALEKEVKQLKTQLQQSPTHNYPAKEYYADASRFARGDTVTLTPWIGYTSNYDASDLLYSESSMNEDLTLLKRRQELERELAKVGDSLSHRALLGISGGVEGQIVYDHDFDHLNHDDVNLSTAEIDLDGMASDWANAFLSLDYDDSPPETGSRVSNSQLYLNRGFLTIGNLDSAPVYFSIGQMYASFGRYYSAMLTTPVTKSLARINDRLALFGYAEDGVYAQAYLFEGNDTSGSNDFARQNGANFGYQNSLFDAGVGYVSNIADSQGMQNTGDSNSNEFQGFGVTSGANGLVHTVPAADGHAEIYLGDFTLIGEYIAATRPFATGDMTFNGHEADVRAAQAEVDYNMHWGKKPANVGISYGQTWESLALNLPEHSIAAMLNVSLWKNTVEGIEFRHDDNYSASDTATGHGLGVASVDIGGQRNMVTLQFGAYF